MTTPTLQLRLLGGFELLKGQDPVTAFGDRRDEQLLALIGVHAPTAVSRNVLAGALWPEFDRVTARKNVSYNLFVLQRVLGELGQAALVHDVRKSLALDPAVEVDADVFGRRIASAATTSSVTARVMLLDQAVSMYGGGLLPGMEEEWLVPHQERFRLLYRNAVSMLATLTQQDQALREMMEHVPTTAWQTARPLPTPVKPTVAAPPPPKDVDRGALAAFAGEAAAGLRSADRAAWIQRVAARLPEIEAAMEEGLLAGDFEHAYAIGVPLWPYWHLAHQAGSGRMWMEALLAARYVPPLKMRAQALHAAGTLAYYDGKREAAREYLAQALALRQQVEGDARGLLETLTSLGIALFGLDELEHAHEVYQQALALALVLQRPRSVLMILLNAAQCEIRRGEAAAARALLDQRLQYVDHDVAPAVARAATLAHLAAVDLMDEALDAASQRATEALALYTAQDNHAGRALSLRLLGRVAYYRGELDTAIGLMRQGLEAARAAGATGELGQALGYLAVTLEAAGHTDEAAVYMWHATAVLRAAGDPGEAQRFAADLAELKGRGSAAPPA